MSTIIKDIHELECLRGTLLSEEFQAVLSIVDNSITYKGNPYIVMCSYAELPEDDECNYYDYDGVVSITKNGCTYICIDAPDKLKDSITGSNVADVDYNLTINDIKDRLRERGIEIKGKESLSKELTMARAALNIGGMTDTAKTFDCLVAFHCLKEGTPIEEIRFSRQKDITDGKVKSFNYLSASSGNRKIAIVEVGVEGYKDLTLEQIFTTFNKPVGYTIADLVEEFVLTSNKFIKWD